MKKADIVHSWGVSIPVHLLSPNLPDFQIIQKGTFDTTIWMLMPQGQGSYEYHGLYPWRENCHVEKFQLSNCGKTAMLFACGEILGNVGKFCHNLCAFMWRKIEPKSTFVEKKWQIWGLLKVGLVWILYIIFAPQYFPELNCNKPLFEDPKSDSLNQRSGSTPQVQIIS